MPGGSGSPAACGLDIGAIGFLTTYAYSFSNHSTTVTQGSQTRTFQTDWLGRPTLIQEPESGQTTYSYAYNSTGLLVTRVRPKENQTNPNVLRTTYSQYDSVGRLVEKWVDDSSTPTKYFYYDTQQWGINPPLQNPKGRLTWHVDMVGSAGTGSVYSYDPMGRVLQIWSCTPTTCGHAAYTGIYTYDWLGNMLTSGDGSGVTDTYTYSPANEVQSITSSLNNSTNPPQLVSNVQNGPFGSTSWQLGNGFTAVRQYDTMGRPAGGWVCQGSSQPWCTGGGDYYYFESWWTGSYLTQSCDSAVNLCNRYGYDSFGRLTSLADMYGPLTYSWVYDRWGNRWQQTPAGGAGSTENVTFNGNNQINSSGFGYDAAGNMTVDPYHTYTYDAEGNLTQVGPGSTASYSYDSLNHRVATTQGGTSEEFLFNPSGQRVSIWQPNQGALGTQIQGQTYWGGMPVEFYQNGQAHFQHQEWLGTERMRTSYNGGVEGTYTSLPFGDALTTTSGTDLDPYHFAGLDHDYSSDTDHAQFRQYSSAPGRWMSPDPYGGSYDQSNPQTFNRYSYAMNNPLGIVDPSGLCPPPGRDGTPQPCYSGGDGGDQGMIDGIDEFDFMEIPVYGYGFGYIPYQSWSGSVNGTPYTAGMVNWGWGIVPLGTGFDFLGGWMPGGNDGQGSDSGGGKASAPNNAQQSKAQQCNAAINSIPGSKVVQFFSLYNLVTNFKNAWVDWTILPGLKIAALTGAKAVSSSIGGTQVLSVTGGTSTVLSGQAAEVIGAGEAAGSEVATPAIALATEMDLAAHQGCNNPGTTSFAGPILFF
jgi:RHS repeat-associated protein